MRTMSPPSAPAQRVGLPERPPVLLDGGTDIRARDGGTGIGTAQPVEDALAHIVHLAGGVVPGADAVSVTLIGRAGPYAAAYTGDLARTLDEAQYRHGDGPALTAATTGGATVHIPDLAADHRWPGWAGIALAAGVRGALSVGLQSRQWVAGALTLYTTSAYAFDDSAADLAGIFAAQMAVTLARAHVRDTVASLHEQVGTVADGEALGRP
jgi:GAF domain-containing protein